MPAFHPGLKDDCPPEKRGACQAEENIFYWRGAHKFVYDLCAGRISLAQAKEMVDEGLDRATRRGAEAEAKLPPRDIGNV